MMRLFSRLLENTTIGLRIILFFVPTIFSFLVLFGWVSLRIYTEYNLELANENLQVRASRLKADIEFRLAGYRTTMTQLTSRGGIAEILEACRLSPGRPVDEFTCYLDLSGEMDPHYRVNMQVPRVYLIEPFLSKDGRYVRYVTDFPAPDLARDLIENRVGLTLSYLPEAISSFATPGRPGLLLARSITDSRGAPLGLLGLEVSITDIARAIGPGVVGDLAWYRLTLGDGTELYRSVSDLPEDDGNSIGVSVDSGRLFAEVGFFPETVASLGVQQRRALVGFAVLFFLLAVAFTVVFARFSTSRVRGFVTRMDEFKIDEEPGPPVPGSDELAQIDRAFLDLAGRLRREVERRERLQEAKNQAESELLFAQLNPHFLYNTLSSIRWRLLQSGDTRAGESIDALIAYYRTMLSDGRQRVPLQTEIEILKEYVRIQQFAYDQEYELKTQVSERAASAITPKMLLQPFVENAVRHGVFKLDRPGVIEVRAWTELSQGRPMVRVEIADNGRGVADNVAAAVNRGQPPESSSSVRMGYGIVNVMERLSLEFGDAARITMSRLQPGTLVTVEYPHRPEPSPEMPKFTG